MIGEKVGYHSWSSDMVGLSWTEMSVLGCQVFERALMESCEVHHICTIKLNQG